MIEDISSVMKDLDNYSLCYKVKDRYKINDFDIKHIPNLIKTKEDKRYLYDFFNDIIHNDQVDYLLEIKILNSENYDKISDKILPKLKKELEKDTKDMER